ncbi:MAG: sigma-70 family RNA polymerase sigma factor [Pseudomonadota bacterium]
MADQALTTFVKEREALISVALRVVHSRAVAEELVQDSWIRWEGKDYAPDKALFIFKRIVTNLARDWTKSRRIEEKILTDLMLLEDMDFDAERIVIARQELFRVVRALESLPEKSAKAFHMRYVDGKSYTEIGKKLGVVRSRAFSLVQDAMVYVACVLKN